MRGHTKIIATIGPAVNSYEKIIELIQAGMNVARLNFSHGTHEEHKKVIGYLKKARKELKRPLAIMLDTKGPEIRIGKLLEDRLNLSENDQIVLIDGDAEKTNEVPIRPFSALKNVKMGTTILFCDGYIASEVIEICDDSIVVKIKNGGLLENRKGVNIPDVEVNLPAMTEQDYRDIEFGCKEDVDLIAASFIRSPEHVLEIKKFLAELKSEDILVIAKIENKQGIENFDKIVEVSDGIMVARGDLGVEVDISLVPKYQKKMIKKCAETGKPVITATQMLESMIVNPRPTRAEASDVANAIYDSTAEVMLSGETAIGKFPILAVKQMKNIIIETEKDIDFKKYFEELEVKNFNDISFSVSVAAVKTAYTADVKAIFVFTSSGFTARLISRLRPKIPIIALTYNRKIYQQMSFYWGVIPVYQETVKDSDHAFSIMSHYAFQEKIVEFGDLIVMTSGFPFGKKGSTNLMMVESIGHILVRGYFGKGDKTEGIIKHLVSIKNMDPKIVDNHLIVIPRCDENYLPFMKRAKGIILQNNIGDTLSEKTALSYAEELKIPIIVQAENALSLLKENEQVVMDPEKGLVYKKEARRKNGFAING